MRMPTRLSAVYLAVWSVFCNGSGFLGDSDGVRGPPSKVRELGADCGPVCMATGYAVGTVHNGTVGDARGTGLCSRRGRMGDGFRPRHLRRLYRTVDQNGLLDTSITDTDRPEYGVELQPSRAVFTANFRRGFNIRSARGCIPRCVRRGRLSSQGAVRLAP